ncbi:MAG: NUDIX hydrolase [Clostridia bacterium]|nr:NUDIX hydrolase [Clostridia bacterium]
MELREKTLKTDEIYKGYVIRLEVSQVECPNGNIAEREIVRHPGGVAVVAVDKDENVYMVKQYRIPYDEIILEVPAGKLDKGENPDDAAERELREETGIVAENITFLGSFYPSVGFCDENLRMYVATGLSFGETDMDEDEFVQLEKIHIDKLTEMIMNNQIKDGKTIAAIFKAREYLKNK